MIKKLEDLLPAWLADKGYDGLYTTDCGCVLNDLAPCGESPMDCYPGVHDKVRAMDYNIDYYIVPIGTKKCVVCSGTGWEQLEDDIHDSRIKECIDCYGTGFEVADD